MLDVTSYLGRHPGGARTLLKATKGDATSAFDNAKHSQAAVWKLKDYDVGAATDLPKLKLAAVKAAATAKRLKAGIAITQRMAPEAGDTAVVAAEELAGSGNGKGTAVET